MGTFTLLSSPSPSPLLPSPKSPFHSTTTQLTTSKTHVPLDISPTDPLSSLPTNTTTSDDSSSLLPNHHLTSTTILGGTNPDIDVLAQTLATTVASALKTRDERETRTVVLGTGLDKSAGGREAFAEVVGLVLDVL